MDLGLCADGWWTTPIFDESSIAVLAIHSLPWRRELEQEEVAFSTNSVAMILVPETASLFEHPLRAGSGTESDRNRFWYCFTVQVQSSIAVLGTASYAITFSTNLYGMNCVHSGHCAHSSDCSCADGWSPLRSSRHSLRSRARSRHSLLSSITSRWSGRV